MQQGLEMVLQLTPEEVQWKSGFSDPNGRTFQWQGRFYRAIWPHRTAFVQSLFHNGIVDHLVDSKLLVPTRICDLQMAGFGMILEHETIPFNTRTFEWPRPALLDAAKMVIQLNLTLLQFGLGTVDFHSFNVLIGKDSRPYWVDFGSIRELSDIDNQPASIKAMNDQFCEYFLNPLLLYTKNMEASWPCRQLLQREKITTADLIALTGMKLDPPLDSRTNWLRTVLAWLKELKFPVKESQWGNYYGTNNTYKLLDPNMVHEPNTRVWVVEQMLLKHKPKTVIDIGCNAGIFSCLAAYHGAEVLATDYDENAIEMFYALLREEAPNLSIGLGVSDVTNWHSQQLFPKKAEMVFGLAIIHHLSLSQGLSFSRIAWLLSRYCTGNLVTDFMPRGLGVDSIVPNPLPAFYTLDKFIASFRPYFRNVYSVEIRNTVGHRIMVCCEGRTDFNECVSG